VILNLLLNNNSNDEVDKAESRNDHNNIDALSSSLNNFEGGSSSGNIVGEGLVDGGLLS